MSLGNFAENELLDALTGVGSYVTTQAYASLHTADPGETGANEVTGGSYARQAASFDAAAAGATANSGALTFATMPAVTITHVGIWDASTAGNFLGGGALSASKVVNAGDDVNIAIGDLDITLD